MTSSFWAYCIFPPFTNRTVKNSFTTYTKGNLLVIRILYWTKSIFNRVTLLFILIWAIGSIWTQVSYFSVIFHILPWVITMDGHLGINIVAFTSTLPMGFLPWLLSIHTWSRLSLFQAYQSFRLFSICRNSTSVQHFFLRVYGTYITDCVRHASNYSKIMKMPFKGQKPPLRSSKARMYCEWSRLECTNSGNRLSAKSTGQTYLMNEDGKRNFVKASGLRRNPIRRSFKRCHHKSSSKTVTRCLATYILFSVEGKCHFLWYSVFLSPPVLMHGGLLGVAFCLSGSPRGEGQRLQGSRSNNSNEL